MAEEFDFADDVNVGGGYVRQPGQYLFCVMEVDEAPTYNNQVLDKIEFTMEVIGGTVPNTTGQRLSEQFRRPQASDSDGGKFSRQILSRLAIAAGIVPGIVQDGKVDIHPSFKGKRAVIDWKHAQGRILVAVVKHREYTKKDGTKGEAYEIDGAKIFHPNDPSVKHVIDAAAKDPVGSKTLAMFANQPSSLQVVANAAPAVNGPVNGSGAVTNGTANATPPAPTTTLAPPMATAQAAAPQPTNPNAWAL